MLSPPNVTSNANKRFAAESLSSSSSQNTKQENEIKQSTHKKIKTCSAKSSTLTSEELTECLEPIRNESENESMYGISIELLKEFILQTIGKPNIAEIAKTYSQDLSALFSMLTDIYGKITSRKLKIRITKIKKAISTEITGVSMDENNFSDCSSCT